MYIRPCYYDIAPLALILPLATTRSSVAQEMAKPTTEMQAVPDKLGALDAKPFSILTIPDARTQASPADATDAVQWDKRLSSNPEAQVTTKDIAIPRKERGLAPRVYMPGETGHSPSWSTIMAADGSSPTSMSMTAHLAR